MKYLKLLILSTCALGFANEAPPESEQVDELVAIHLSDDRLPYYSQKVAQQPQVHEILKRGFTKESGRLLVFGEVDMLLPGCGVAMRKHGPYSGFEFSGSAFLLGAKFSASYIHMLGNNPEKNWYVGAGAGTLVSFIFILSYNVQGLFKFYAPLFIGFEGEKYFSDIGVDLVVNAWRKPVTPLPVLRCGFMF